MKSINGYRCKDKYKTKRIKAVFFDIDNTLHIKDSGYMPPAIQKVFQSLKNREILTGIATGRPYGLVPKIRKLELDFFITSNGSYVFDYAGRVIFINSLPRDIITR